MIRAALLFIRCLCLSISAAYFIVTLFLHSASTGFAVLAGVGFVSLIAYVIEEGRE